MKLIEGVARYCSYSVVFTLIDNNELAVTVIEKSLTEMPLVHTVSEGLVE